MVTLPAWCQREFLQNETIQDVLLEAVEICQEAELDPANEENLCLT